jgi:hypothetical protein
MVEVIYFLQEILMDNHRFVSLLLFLEESALEAAKKLDRSQGKALSECLMTVIEKIKHISGDRVQCCSCPLASKIGDRVICSHDGASVLHWFKTEGAPHDCHIIHMRETKNKLADDLVKLKSLGELKRVSRDEVVVPEADIEFTKVPSKFQDSDQVVELHKDKELDTSEPIDRSLLTSRCFVCPSCWEVENGYFCKEAMLGLGSALDGNPSWCPIRPRSGCVSCMLSGTDVDLDPARKFCAAIFVPFENVEFFEEGELAAGGIKSNCPFANVYVPDCVECVMLLSCSKSGVHCVHPMTLHTLRKRSTIRVCGKWEASHLSPRDRNHLGCRACGELSSRFVENFLTLCCGKNRELIIDIKEYGKHPECPISNEAPRPLPILREKAEAIGVTDGMILRGVYVVGEKIRWVLSHDKSFDNSVLVKMKLVDEICSCSLCVNMKYEWLTIHDVGESNDGG